jgi:hypothetical protein
MQRFPTRRSSSTPLLMAAVGIGALAAYALSSPRRRAALAAASQSVLDAGSRLIGQPGRTADLEESFEEATARQPETFRDEANEDKLVEIGADKTRTPIRGFDAPERPGR